MKIYGMIVSTGDPVMIQSAGGMFQTVPAARMASTEKLKASLMYEPSQLGLDAQKIADIIAWLQEVPSPGKAASH